MRKILDGLCDLSAPRAPGEPDRAGVGAKLLVLLVLALTVLTAWLAARP